MKIKAFNNRRGKGLELKITDVEFHDIVSALMFYNKRKDHYFKAQINHVKNVLKINYTADEALEHGWVYCCYDIAELFEKVLDMFESGVGVDKIEKYIKGGFRNDDVF